MTENTTAARRKPWRWYARMPLWQRMAIAALTGAGAALGQAPWDQTLLMLLLLSMGFLMLRRQKTARHAGAVGWAFGTGYFALALHWIVEPFQVDAARHAWMAPFALLFLSTGLALFWGGAFWAARALSLRTWPLILTWTAAEILRAYAFTGFPWASPAQSLIDGPASRALAFSGPHGAMLWLMCLAWLLSFPAVFRHRPVMRAAQIAALVCAALLFHLPLSAPPPVLTDHTVRLIQPNAAQHLKWQPGNAELFFRRQLELTSEAPRDPGNPPDLVVWPETAIPWALDRAGPALEQIVQTTAVGVVLGALRLDADGLYNSLVVLQPDGTPGQVYDKHHLVPFGEYMPLSSLTDRLGISGLASNGRGFSAGPGPRLLDFGPLGRALPLICYEAVFSQGLFGTSERPDFLLQITNDAWFGQHAGPAQHLAQARMRAIEQGLPLMRSANTGITAMIDPRGRITASLATGIAGGLDVRLPAPGAPTLFSRTGNLPVLLLLSVGLAGLILLNLKNRPAAA